MEKPVTEQASAERVSPGRNVSLGRVFRAIIFDWDGTAVASRSEDASPLADLIERLLRKGVWIVVVTGTRFDHVDRQICRLIAPGQRRRLLVCTNRGSEVYGFNIRGVAVRRWLRQSTPSEEATLTAIAEGVRDAVMAQTGLPVSIVYDRLNRRKIDLIPEPAWSDPPKSRIGELILAVEARLCGAGLEGGLAEIIELTGRLAAEHGLPNARITSDVKHVEVGLTDKGDSVAWVKEHLLRPCGIALADVLIVGDELGPIAGFVGSDDRLRAEAEGATVISVGREPNGVPPGVLHLPGGPARFRETLADQLRRHDRQAPPRTMSRLRPTVAWVEEQLAVPIDPDWRIEEHGFHPAREHDVESRLALSNGHIGVRASLALPTAASLPRTFIAGLFDLSSTEPVVPSLVSAPDWTCLELSFGDRLLAVIPREAPAHPRTLDYRRGVLVSDWRLGDGAGHTARLRSLRFVSLADRSIAAEIARIEVDRPGELTLEVSLNRPVAVLEPSPGTEAGTVSRTARTRQHLGIASVTELRLGQKIVQPKTNHSSPTRWSWMAVPGDPAILTRVLAVTREDTASDADDTSQRALRSMRRRGLTGTLAAHARAWAERWDESDVVVRGDDEALEALRFALYHLVGAANPNDDRVSVGARALTGEAYLGHVFWDTEIFLLPFYTLTWPAAARAMLMYRVRTLPAARAKAERLGFRGALYAWESADSGEETTPPYAVGPNGRVIPIRCGTEEHHISADIAYAAWQYWQATGDGSFLLDGGADVILETARFWASRATLEGDGRYHIRGVIGPDEYHEGVDDNAYTNVMAQWNLERGVEVQALLQARWPERWTALSERLNLEPDELAAWRDIACRMTVEIDPQSGVLEQFSGYFGLEPLDLTAYASRTVAMDVLLGPERTRRSQVIKQADVVMLLALLWDRFSPEQRVANYRYYEPRCGHGSSLSPAMHALVAARLGDVDGAERYFHQAASIDLDDAMGNTAGGVHIAALGGLWQAVVFGFAGLALCPDSIRLDPHLPSTWRRLRFRLRWRKRRVQITLWRKPLTVSVSLERGRPMRIHLGDLVHRLTPGAPWVCRQSGAHDSWTEVTIP